MLLRFRVANHRSIRDEAELSMISPSLRTMTAPGGNWVGSTVRVAAVYGANAAGKSNLLGAIDFLVQAVRKSATTWADRSGFPYTPYRLSDTSLEQPSFYEISVAVDGVRYDYGFVSDATGVQREWLYSYPEGRKRRLLTRDGPSSDDLVVRAGSTDENSALRRLVSPRVLALSAAALVGHQLFSTVRAKVVAMWYARLSDDDRATRLAQLRDIASRPDLDFGLLATPLLAMADVGIGGVEVVKSTPIDPQAVALVVSALSGRGEKLSESEARAQAEQAADRIGKRFAFQHLTEGPRTVPILEDDQSSGTLAWLSLAFSALLTCADPDSGGVPFLVDELDASLHPRLAAALVGMFKDPTINRSGAQLVFTTHDVAFINPSFELLAPEEVWFVEKESGATTLYSLAEFPTRREDNFAKRYLDGRYGAVPMVSLDPIRRLLRSNPDEPQPS